MGTGSHGEDRGCGPDLALQRVFETGVHDRLEISDLLSQALAIHSVSGGTGCGVRHRCSAAASGTAVHGTRRGTSRAVRCERDLSEACTETKPNRGWLCKRFLFPTIAHGQANTLLSANELTCDSSEYEKRLRRVACASMTWTVQTRTTHIDKKHA